MISSDIVSASEFTVRQLKFKAMNLGVSNSMEVQGSQINNFTKVISKFGDGSLIRTRSFQLRDVYIIN